MFQFDLKCKQNEQLHKTNIFPSLLKFSMVAKRKEENENFFHTFLCKHSKSQPTIFYYKMWFCTREIQFGMRLNKQPIFMLLTEQLDVGLLTFQSFLLAQNADPKLNHQLQQISCIQF